ncbi:MAG TPA: hypothetical protein VHG32_04140 [Thermoanaerobaculia bacterium]|jgi:hypothetical protein|nr:hypothetical protein [Thermoanaerobaculia bacterium]
MIVSQAFLHMSVNLGCSVNLPAVGAAIVLEGTTPAEAAALNPAAQSRLVRGPLPGAWRSPVPAPAAEGDGGGMPVGNTLRQRRDRAMAPKEATSLGGETRRS